MGERKGEFELPTEKVKVRFIKRKVGIAATVADNHIISGGMLEGSYKKLPVPMLKHGGLKNVLTKEEKLYLEAGPYEGQNLSMYSKFWETQYVSLEKTGTILDLSVPQEYLKYKILLAWDTIIAPTLKDYKERPSLAYLFYMERDGEEDRITSKTLNATKAAWKNFNKIEDNREVLAAVVFLMTGKKLAGNASLEYMNTQVEKLVDTKTEQFNTLVNDSKFETKILLANAEREGIIVKSNGKYETKDGLPLVEGNLPATIDNVVKFINDPLNNNVFELIQTRLDNIKE